SHHHHRKRRSMGMTALRQTVDCSVKQEKLLLAEPFPDGLIPAAATCCVSWPIRGAVVVRRRLVGSVCAVVIGRIAVVPVIRRVVAIGVSGVIAAVVSVIGPPGPAAPTPTTVPASIPVAPLRAAAIEPTARHVA